MITTIVTMGASTLAATIATMAIIATIATISMIVIAATTTICDNQINCNGCK